MFVSERNIPLIFQGPVNKGELYLTVENYHKWYKLYLVSEQGVTPVDPAVYSLFDKHMTWVDHEINPEAFALVAYLYRAYFDPITLETVVGRWVMAQRPIPKDWEYVQYFPLEDQWAANAETQYPILKETFGYPDTIKRVDELLIAIAKPAGAELAKSAEQVAMKISKNVVFGMMTQPAKSSLFGAQVVHNAADGYISPNVKRMVVLQAIKKEHVDGINISPANALEAAIAHPDVPFFAMGLWASIIHNGAATHDEIMAAMGDKVRIRVNNILMSRRVTPGEEIWNTDWPLWHVFMIKSADALLSMANVVTKSTVKPYLALVHHSVVEPSDELVSATIDGELYYSAFISVNVREEE